MAPPTLQHERYFTYRWEGPLLPSAIFQHGVKIELSRKLSNQRKTSNLLKFKLVKCDLSAMRSNQFPLYLEYYFIIKGYKAIALRAHRQVPCKTGHFGCIGKA